MRFEVWLHWYMVGFFVLFGIAILAVRRCFASVRGLIRVKRLDQPYADRLEAAIVRRERLESLPSAAMAAAVGGASLLAGMLAVVTHVPDILLYAFLSLVLAFTLATAYLKLRAGGRRVASLRARSRDAIVPTWLYASVAVAAVSPLVFIDIAPVAAVLVTIAAVTIGVVGDRVARLPALLSGEDPVVEQYVDDRLRAVRAVNLIGTATAPAYVFEAVTASLAAFRGGFGGFAGLHGAAMLFTLVVLVAAVCWQLRLVRSGPDTSELARWSRLAV